MAKAILQSVGDETVAFGDQCYWVAENVKRFLPNFQPNMEVDITVKDIDGTPMVTFLKKSGFAPAAPSTPKPAAPPTQYQTPAAPPQQYQAPAAQFAPKPPAPAPTGGLKGDLDMLTAAICVAYNLDMNQVKATAAAIKGL